MAVWEAKAIPEEFTNAELLYDVSRHHKLLHASAAATVAGLRDTAKDAKIYTFWAGGEQTATMIISRISDGWQATVDLIPVSKHFRGKYKEPLRDAARKILLKTMEDHNLHRLNAWVPASRARAIRGLEACGFIYEGAMRAAVQLDENQPDSLVILGLLRGE